MTETKIIERCVGRLGMSQEDAEWVAENLYIYAQPDYSEWSWEQIDACFKDVLQFKGTAGGDIEAGLA